jgi:hypothetical protein
LIRHRFQLYTDKHMTRAQQKRIVRLLTHEGLKLSTLVPHVTSRVNEVLHNEMIPKDRINEALDLILNPHKGAEPC